ncbi:TetR/AcrR family transcriptional regulator [Nocardia gipuzkoensis]
MGAEEQPSSRAAGRARMSLRNRAALLEAAQRQFLRFGVGASLEAVAKDVGVGPGTLYRHFPNREALLAAVLRSRSEELEARRADIAQLERRVGKAALDGGIFQRVQRVAGTAHGCREGIGTGQPTDGALREHHRLRCSTLS